MRGLEVMSAKYFREILILTKIVGKPEELKGSCVLF